MNPIKAVVFDLYGTLYDVHSVVARCDALFPGRGQEISNVWRQKQLEYTWLRSLMGAYAPFEDITEHALRYTCNRLQLMLSDAELVELSDEYSRIEPFREVPGALAELQAMGLPLAILSNGSARSIRGVVSHSGLESRFAHLLSVEDADGVKVFKPHPAVYTVAEQKLNLPRTEILFVSSNAWDASGARHFGFPVCWVNRAGNTFEELGQKPDHIVSGLDELADWLRPCH
ncbi:2-haloacid dehalogenase [Trinickia symbiotica]|uniref:(S)-2-haloacid dehalogenase n=1 Tax=Trinickia symbiotica TaxID=863227 RepID=A0A2N7WQQ0_9BURK|nr:haloacid dehalogenase type II [Trinickia symbiotica]PMS31645.1 haloacid dehalogenase type II [Trinickia symbiotica]PPK41282.1 2-haloacid dehalogenase [Trinickia symbiotica]